MYIDRTTGTMQNLGVANSILNDLVNQQRLKRQQDFEIGLQTNDPTLLSKVMGQSEDQWRKNYFGDNPNLSMQQFLPQGQDPKAAAQNYLMQTYGDRTFKDASGKLIAVKDSPSAMQYYAQQEMSQKDSPLQKIMSQQPEYTPEEMAMAKEKYAQAQNEYRKNMTVDRYNQGMFSQDLARAQQSGNPLDLMRAEINLQSRGKSVGDEYRSDLLRAAKFMVKPSGGPKYGDFTATVNDKDITVATYPGITFQEFAKVNMGKTGLESEDSMRQAWSSYKKLDTLDPKDRQAIEMARAEQVKGLDITGILGGNDPKTAVEKLNAAGFVNSRGNVDPAALKSLAVNGYNPEKIKQVIQLAKQYGGVNVSPVSKQQPASSKGEEFAKRMMNK